MSNILQREVFRHIYETDAWTNGSGPGSHPKVVAPYLTYLTQFLTHHRIASMVDLGCGDWQHTKLLKFPPCLKSYIGLDIVPSVVYTNQALYSTHPMFPSELGIRFELYPEILSSNICPPQCDLLLLKDVIIHWPNEEVLRFFSALPFNPKHVLIVNESHSPYGRTNQDIKLGEFRPVDPTLPPFNLPFTRTFSWPCKTVPKNVWHRQCYA